MTARIQNQVHTVLFRETELFASALAYSRRWPRRLRILSFGCSIGDELASLRFYFPDAEIVGAEIDETALAIARESVGNLAHVIKSDVAELKQHAPFDLIFALSSLCVNPLRGKIGDHLPFEKFEAACAQLDDMLAVGGLLALKNTSYLFKHTKVARAYDVVRSDLVEACGFVDVFDPDGKTILSQRHTPLGPVSLLEAPDAVSSDWDLIDSLFVKRASDAEAGAIHDLHLSWPERPPGLKVRSQWSRSRAALVPPDVYDCAIVVVDHYTALGEGVQAMLEKRIERRFLVGETAPGRWVTLSVQPALSAMQWVNRLA